MICNIQGTRKYHSGDMEGTWREHPGDTATLTYDRPSLDVSGIVSRPDPGSPVKRKQTSVWIQWICKRIQWICSESCAVNSVNLCAVNSPTNVHHVQWIQWIQWICVQWIQWIRAQWIQCSEFSESVCSEFSAVNSVNLCAVNSPTNVHHVQWIRWICVQWIQCSEFGESVCEFSESESESSCAVNSVNLCAWIRWIISVWIRWICMWIFVIWNWNPLQKHECHEFSFYASQTKHRKTQSRFKNAA
jgi:hypothetical protein